MFPIKSNPMVPNPIQIDPMVPNPLQFHLMVPNPIKTNEFQTSNQVAVKGAQFEENHDIAMTLARMMNDGKPFADMMHCRDMMLKELKDKVLSRNSK